MGDLAAANAKISSLQTDLATMRTDLSAAQAAAATQQARPVPHLEPHGTCVESAKLRKQCAS